MRPGIGTVVAAPAESTAAERTELLGREIEELAVEAIRLGIGLRDMLASIAEHWKLLGGRNRMEEETDRGGGRKK